MSQLCKCLLKQPEHNLKLIKFTFQDYNRKDTRNKHTDNPIFEMVSKLIMVIMVNKKKLTKVSENFQKMGPSPKRKKNLENDFLKEG